MESSELVAQLRRSAVGEVRDDPASRRALRDDASIYRRRPRRPCARTTPTISTPPSTPAGRPASPDDARRRDQPGGSGDRPGPGGRLLGAPPPCGSTPTRASRRSARGGARRPQPCGRRARSRVRTGRRDGQQGDPRGDDRQQLRRRPLGGARTHGRPRAVARGDPRRRNPRVAASRRAGSGRARGRAATSPRRRGPRTWCGASPATRSRRSAATRPTGRACCAARRARSP